MKRSGPLKRRTPLRSKTPLRNGRKDDGWQEVRRQVIDRDRTCQAVGTHSHDCGMGWHVHHIRRRSQGGTNDPYNLVLLCGIAHSYVHDHPAWARTVGLLA